ncbi:MAG: sulfotransferase [Rubrobacteraceae bacterium]
MEQAIWRLKDYRLKNKRFDRIAETILSNGPAAKVARASVSAAMDLSRRGRSLEPGDYDRVFFIVGEMRSGTSWLRRTLSAHPEVSCNQEASFFGRDYDREEIPVYPGPVSSLTRALAQSGELKTWHGLPWNQWADGYEEDLRNLTRLSVDYFLSKEVARTGKRIVGDKSPQHTECLREMHGIYPDARIIHIVRDGRDVAVSAMHHWWRLANDKEGGVFDLSPEELGIRDAYLADREGFVKNGRSIFTEERLGQLARRWAYRTRKAHEEGPELYGKGYLEIRYEDLLGDAPGVLKQVLDLLGARTDSRTLDYCIQASSFERASNREQGKEDAGSFFRKGVAGDWRNVFTGKDRETFDRFAGEDLAKFGYESPRAQKPGT